MSNSLNNSKKLVFYYLLFAKLFKFIFSSVKIQIKEKIQSKVAHVKSNFSLMLDNH